VADYSEFPTTPTAWQEQQLRDWETITPLSTEDTAPPPRRRVDLVALVPAVLFAMLALTVMIGGVLPHAIFEGGVLWVALLGAGIALLISELRKARGRR
jgi:Na+/H+ antiporter NhaD/arsenite permease-like protein